MTTRSAAGCAARTTTGTSSTCTNRSQTPPRFRATPSIPPPPGRRNGQTGLTSRRTSITGAGGYALGRTAGRRGCTLGPTAPPPRAGRVSRSSWPAWGLNLRMTSAAAEDRKRRRCHRHLTTDERAVAAQRRPTAASRSGGASGSGGACAESGGGPEAAGNATRPARACLRPGSSWLTVPGERRRAAARQAGRCRQARRGGAQTRSAPQSRFNRWMSTKNDRDARISPRPLPVSLRRPRRDALRAR